MATRKDVAKMAGVSDATVSYVINNTKPITPEVKARVLKAIETLDYRPNLVARSLATKETRHVALIIDNLKNPYYAEILEGAQTMALKYNYIISVIFLDLSNTNQLSDLISRGVDGVIIAAGNLPSDAIKLANIPHVSIGNILHIDYRQGIYQMVDCLQMHHHRHIAFLSGLSISNPFHSRYYELLNALHHFDLVLNPHLVVDGVPGNPTDEKAGYLAMNQLLERKINFSAVFALNDLMALGACKAAKEKGFAVPQDISIIGCDNIKILEYISPTLSTISVHAFDIGSQLMQLLVDTIKGNIFSTQTITSYFIARESIGQAKRR